MLLPSISLSADIIFSVMLILLNPTILLGLKPVRTNYFTSSFKTEISEKAEPYPSLTEFDKKLKDFYTSIEVVMQKDQPFLDENFTREKLSSLTNIPIHNITKSLQKYAGVSFNDYINTYRIEYIYAMLKSNPSWFDFTLEALSMRAGFSNRGTFNNALKKIKGIKPSEMIFELRSLYKKRNF